MKKRKICVVTGTRAEYGLLHWLMQEIVEDEALELQLIVTGMHLSPEFGLTYKVIEESFEIDKKIEMLLSSDTAVGIAKSMGLAQISFVEAYAELKPDLLVLLGDRYEIFAAAASAMIANIPIAHLHGGETTEGAFDESIRHSITKMSHLHFTATKTYRHRVIQMGEEPSRVFNVGGIGLDNIQRLSLFSKEEFEAAIGVELKPRNILVTFHPVTLEDATAQEQFEALLEVISSLEDTLVIFTKANSDKDGRIINQMIDDYVADHPESSLAFVSLGQLRYLSALQFMDAVVGNSSSGLIEAPSFKIGTINIGDRQKGRMMASSVINCEPTVEEITRAFDLLYSDGFKWQLAMVENPYGSGGASLKIKKVIKEFDLKNILKKRFYDVPMEGRIDEL